MTQAASGEEFSSLAETRGGNRMERRLTEERGGGDLRKKKKTLKRNEWVEDAGNFKKNSPILYFSRSEYLLLVSPAPLSDSFIRFVKDAF